MREQEVNVVPEHPKGWRLLSKKWIFILFLFVAGSLVFFAFSDNPITGRFIQQSYSNETANFHIAANLETIGDPLEISGEIGELRFEVAGSSSKIKIGKDGVTDLSELRSAVITLTDFDGTFLFDSTQITKLKGKAAKVTVNGIPTASLRSGIQIEINEAIDYTGVSLQNFYISNRAFQSTGTIEVNEGKLSLDLNDETLIIEDFFGDLKSGVLEDLGILRNGVSFEGFVSHAEIEGSFNLNLFK